MLPRYATASAAVDNVDTAGISLVYLSATILGSATLLKPGGVLTLGAADDGGLGIYCSQALDDEWKVTVTRCLWPAATTSKDTR